MAKFQKGRSGNPGGRPKGSKDKRQEIRALLEPHRKALINKAVSLAKRGDTTALKLCLDRLMAPLRARDAATPIPIDGETLSDQGRSILAALSRGELTAQEATQLMGTVAAVARFTELEELKRRVAELEVKNVALS